MLVNFNKKLFTKKFKNIINGNYENATKRLKLPQNLEINVAFVNGKQIRDLNREFRQIDKVTDVLSFPNLLDLDKPRIIEDELNIKNFPNDVNPETNNIMLGDIYICVSRAKKQSKEYGHSVEREMGYLAVHGLLHVLGYDHINDADKVVMRMREEEIVQQSR